MSIPLIQQDYSSVEKLIRYGAQAMRCLRFADYKEQVIGLLMGVCMVSVETMKIIREMP